MDLEKRNRVIQKVYAIYDQRNTLPAVTLDEFFDGNDDSQSIAVNLTHHPGIEEFKKVLYGIKGRNDVQDVFVEIHECPDPNVSLDDDMWLTAMVVFVITSASVEDVENWVQSLRPDLVHLGWNVKEGVQTPLGAIDLKPGMKPIRVWWD